MRKDAVLSQTLVSPQGESNLGSQGTVGSLPCSRP